MVRARSSNLLGKITVLLIVGCFCLPAQGKYGGGSGTAEDPYLIYDANQMNAIGADSNDWDKHFKLMANIDLSGFTGTSFNIIGTWKPRIYFTGVFDGSGHTISNFSYTSTDTDDVGLFGCIRAENAEIKNLGLIDPDINAGTGYYVGSLVGLLTQGTITNCFVEGGSISGGGSVGGLVGLNSGTIANCYSTGSVSGFGTVGGLLGCNGGTGGTITNSYATGSVAGNERVGGFVGCNFYGTIFNSYSHSDVSGNEQVGGLVGDNYGTITNCYSIGSVSGDQYVGGLVGHNVIGDTTASFWDIETSGQTTSDGGTGLPTAQMQMASTFINAGWDFENVWWILEGTGYPRFCWEAKYGGGTGEPNDPYLIYTAEQMNEIELIGNRDDWDKCFKLMADIDLSAFTGTSFNIIGNYENTFTGVFDGNNHTISNFTYTSTDTDYIGLFGYVDRGEIKNLRLIDPNVDAGTGNCIGSLVGYLRDGTITDCFAEGASVSGNWAVGGLVGNSRYGMISKCHATGLVIGDDEVGGLVGDNYAGTIYNCYATGLVDGGEDGYEIGGLVGGNWERSTISESCATGSVIGNQLVGGLVGYNKDTIYNCYATGSVTGNHTSVGGLAGATGVTSTISNCYATGQVDGGYFVGGGLVGFSWDVNVVTYSFWDIETSGQTISAGGRGKTTAEMQTESTFTDAGWDFFGETTNGTDDIWFVDEGVGYPRLWWETVPVLHAEPEVTLGTSNIISWGPLPSANEYYAECAEDADFTSIVYNSGWITETSYEFTGLELGKCYWYSVKARNAAGIESQWSNVESSLQCSLSDAVEIMLDPNNLKSENLKKPYIHKINIAQEMIDRGIYTGALSKLENDILPKTDGCGERGQPDKSDWIITCEAQGEIYPLLIEIIDYLKDLMEQSLD